MLGIIPIFRSLVQSHQMRPGEDMIEKGLADLEAGRETIESLLVSIGASRLRSAGIDVPSAAFRTPEHRLYKLLCLKYDNAAHSKYNALIRRLVSFERAAEHEKTIREKHRSLQETNG